MGASLMGRSYFWQDYPNFFRLKENNNFTMASMGTFCFVVLILRDSPIRDLRNYWGYLLRRWFSLMHILVLGGPSQFLCGAKIATLGQTF